MMFFKKLISTNKSTQSGRMDVNVDVDIQEYNKALSTVHSLLMDGTDFQKAAVYDLAIWSIGRAVAADGCSNLMLGRRVINNHDLSFHRLFPILSEAKGEVEVIDIAKCNAYTGCWHYDRIAHTVDSIFKNGYRQAPASKGIYYPELRMAIMLEGRHHTSWATYLNDCKVNLQVIKLTPYFDIVKTDGAFYYYKNSYGEDQKIRLADFRMAVLFQLAKERSMIDLPNTADAYQNRKL